MEILQNSILKLIVRQGSDSDRRSIILNSGELGYTVDTYRLFVGDGFLSGGNVTGNLFKGFAPTITNVSLWPSIKGDTAFATDSNSLFALSAGVGNNLADWFKIGGVYSSGSPEITISPNNTVLFTGISSYSITTDALSSPISLIGGKIALNPLSAGHISQNALTSPLSIVSGKIAIQPLSSNSISTDALSSPLTISNGKITLNPLSAGHISQNALETPLIISNGKIALSNIPIHKVSTKTFTIGSGLNVLVDGNPANNTAFNPLSSNIELTSNQIYAKYYGSSNSLEFSKNILSVEKVSVGYYRFNFASILPSENYITISQLIGLDNLSYITRVVSQSIDHCDLKIVNSSGSSIDANIYLLINY